MHQQWDSCIFLQKDLKYLDKSLWKNWKSLSLEHTLSQPWRSHYWLPWSLSILLSLLQELHEGLSSVTEELNGDFSTLSLTLFLGKNDIMVWFGTLEMCNFPFACDLTALSPITLILNSFSQSLPKASLLLPLIDLLSQFLYAGFESRIT